jgi:hypothetical protein
LGAYRSRTSKGRRRERRGHQGSGAAVAAVAAANAPIAKRTRLLLIEDNRLLRDAIAEMLHGHADLELVTAVPAGERPCSGCWRRSPT